MSDKSPREMSNQALLAEHATLNQLLDGRITNRNISGLDLAAMSRRRVALNDEILRRDLKKPGSTNHGPPAAAQAQASA